MSAASLCDRFDVTLKQKTSTRDAAGGVTIAYSIEARAGRPTSVRAELQTMTSEEKIEYGIKGERKTWAMYCVEDPNLQTEDLASWTDASEISRSAVVIEPSFAMAGRARIWKTVLEEVEAQS